MKSIKRTTSTPWTLVCILAMIGTAPGSLPGQDFAAAAARMQDGAPKDLNPAMNQPHKFAWNLFITVNRAARASGRDTAWETWTEQDYVYANPCVKPQWADGGPREVHTSRLVSLINQLSVSAAPIGTGYTQEIRINRVAFDYIVDNELWYQEGLLRHAQAEGVEFPLGSVVFKADWKAITEADKPRYHWQILPDPNNDDEPTLMGMVAAGLIAKDLPYWFWSTWEHVDNLGRCDVLGCRDDFGSEPGYVPPHRVAGGPYEPGELKPEVIEMMSRAGLGPQWRSYRLKGTQVEFADAKGQPFLMANSVQEPGFQSTSSCMTCHARAAINRGAGSQPSTPGGYVENQSLGVFKSTQPLEGWVGTPDPGWYFQSHAVNPLRPVPIVYTTDFLYQLTSLPKARELCCAPTGQLDSSSCQGGGPGG